MACHSCKETKVACAIQILKSYGNFFLSEVPWTFVFLDPMTGSLGILSGQLGCDAALSARKTPSVHLAPAQLLPLARIGL